MNRSVDEEKAFPIMNSDRNNVIKYCLGSGFCAAAASVVGKLATDPMFLCTLMPGTAADVQDDGLNDGDDDSIRAPSCRHALSIDPGSILYLSCQAILILFMIFINSFMWTLFSKALSMSASTTEASVMNMGFNFFFTALFSFLIFGEGDSLNLHWFLGSLIMLIGLLLLNSDEPGAPDALNPDVTLPVDKFCKKDS